MTDTVELIKDVVLLLFNLLTWGTCFGAFRVRQFG
jgi:hypothetical protein